MRVDQWLPAAHRGDAIGDEAIRIRDALLRRGHDGDIYALDVDEEALSDVRPFHSRARSDATDVTVLHFALPSPLTREFAETGSKKILIYHNITPAEHFVGIDAELARMAHMGRRELASLRDVTDLALGDSEFNRKELVSLGFPKERTGVLPILLDFAPYLRERVESVLDEMLSDGRPNFLFVGRVYPNKKFEDLARLAFFYKKYVSEDFRFLLVGKAGRMQRYQDAVQALADRWGLVPSEFLFTGHLSWEDLLACYARADVFVSMSEHEGFAVPLVESMLMELPVLAYEAGAVPDTLGGAGVTFREKNFEELAEMAQVLVSEKRVRDSLVSAGRTRVARFAPRRVEEELVSFVTEVCS